MPNVETEQKAGTPTQPDTGAPSASIALCEENLEALLRAVSESGAPTERQREQKRPVPVEPAAAENDTGAAMEKAASATVAQSVPEEPSPAETDPAAAVQTEPEPSANPVAVEEASTVAPQPDVFSKLALISSIKQRRAITARPESAEAEPVASGSAPAETAEVEAPAPATKKLEEAPANVSNQTATEPELAESAAPANSKLWTNRPAARRHESPKTGVGKATSSSTENPLTANEIFAALEAGRTQAPLAKPKSFATSKAGLAIIGGAILAGTLVAFYLSGHTAKHAANPGMAVTPAAAPVVTSAAPVIPAVSQVDSANAKSAADKAREIAPAAAISRDEKPSPAAAAKPEAAQPQAAAQPPAPVRPPAATESPRTTARAFAPPTPASRPTSSPIVDAPPAIASNATAPTAVSLPARFAPLPPPAPAAAPTPAASSVPASAQPINVSGNVQATKLTRQVVPVYPAVAKAARVQGTVRFRVIIGTDGQVKSLTTLGGPPPLAQAAADAVRQWRYQPTLVDGKPVEVSTEIDVAFTL